MKSRKKLLVLAGATAVLMLASFGCGAKETKTPEKAAETSGNTIVAGDRYVGDQACKTCHEEVFTDWGKTSHAGFVTDAKANPKAIPGNFDGNYPKMLNFGKDDIQYVLLSQPGMLKVQELVGKKGTFGVPADDYPVLWGSWDSGKNEWEIEVEAIGEGTPWLTTCAGCHVTDLKVPTDKKPDAAKTFSGFGITCEQCHGPGKEHAANPREAKLVVSVAAENCGQCHTRGASTAKKPDGKNFGYPYNAEKGQYTPGEKFEDFYAIATPEQNPKDFWPTKHAKNSHHLQYPEWTMTGHATSLATLKTSDHAKEECLKCHSAEAYLAKEGEKVTLDTAKNSVTCQVCHGSHDPKAGEGMLRVSRNEVCTQCHNSAGSLVIGKEAHHPHKELTQGTIGLGFAVEPSKHSLAGVTCVDCHMPKTASPKASHLMKVVLPKEGKQHSMPDSCSACHPSAGLDFLQKNVDEWQGDVTKQMAAVKAKLDAKKAQAGTTQYKEALMYYQIVEADGSKGVHNYELSMKLLNSALQKLK